MLLSYLKLLGSALNSSAEGAVDVARIFGQVKGDAVSTPSEDDEKLGEWQKK